MSEQPATPWPLWQKILAYTVLSAISLTAIYIVDVKVMRHQSQPTAHPVVRDDVTTAKF